MVEYRGGDNMKQSTKYLKILVNLLVAVFTIVCLCFIFPRLIVFFMPFVVGWIISMIANPLVRFLERKMKIVRCDRAGLSGNCQNCAGMRQSY